MHDTATIITKIEVRLGSEVIVMEEEQVAVAGKRPVLAEQTRRLAAVHLSKQHHRLPSIVGPFERLSGSRQAPILLPAPAESVRTANPTDGLTRERNRSAASVPNSVRMISSIAGRLPESWPTKSIAASLSPRSDVVSLGRNQATGAPTCSVAEGQHCGTVGCGSHSLGASPVHWLLSPATTRPLIGMSEQGSLRKDTSAWSSAGP